MIPTDERLLRSARRAGFRANFFTVFVLAGSLVLMTLGSWLLLEWWRVRFLPYFTLGACTFAAGAFIFVLSLKVLRISLRESYRVKIASSKWRATVTARDGSTIAFFDDTVATDIDSLFGLYTWSYGSVPPRLAGATNLGDGWTELRFETLVGGRVPYVLKTTKQIKTSDVPKQLLAKFS